MEPINQFIDKINPIEAPYVKDGDIISIKYELKVIEKDGKMAFDFDNLDEVDVDVAASDGSKKYYKQLKLKELSGLHTSSSPDEFGVEQNTGPISTSYNHPEQTFKTDKEFKFPSSYGRVSLSYPRIIMLLKSNQLNKNKNNAEILSELEHAKTPDDVKDIIKKHDLRFDSNYIGGKTKKRVFKQLRGKRTRRQ